MLSKKQILTRIKIIECAYKNRISHIPSALSMLDYLTIIDKKIDYNKDCLVIGKPYGQLAYSIIWNTNDFSPISVATKNVIWCDSTIGNCLGIAVGLALSNKYRNIYVNVSDAALQEGTILEALLFIGSLRYKLLKKIVLLVDYNNYQCISKTYIKYSTFLKLIKNNGFDVISCNGHDTKLLKEKIKINNNRHTALCFLFKTIKGYGIDFMQHDPISWHYRKLDEPHYKKVLQQLCVK